jgi:hypothetical protein
MNKFNWVKQGQIFDPRDFNEWGQTHGQVPFFIKIKDQQKIFFTSRPPLNENGEYVSFIHAIDVEKISNTFKIQKLYTDPFLHLGDIGCFDEFGTMPCSLIKHPNKDEIWLYYVGWSRKISSPYDCAIGLAISTNNGETFKKISNGPLISSNTDDPFVLGCPRVYIFNNKWYMFYLAGIKWINFNGRKECYYKLRVATSVDGLIWQRNDRFIISEKYENESQTCASIFYFENKYHMYFTFRHTIDFRNPERGYRVGYAYSFDLINWERNDEIGNFSVSKEGWDSEMVCYPQVVDNNGSIEMFYCGNKFGLNGFGFAKLIP